MSRPNQFSIPPKLAPNSKLKDKGQIARESRDKWAQRWGGASYLDVIPSNRLILSLRSGIATEVDWALDRILQVSGEDPELLLLTQFINLLSALLAIIQTFLNLRVDQAQVEKNLMGMMRNGNWEVAKSRATVAALVIKNLAIEEENLNSILANKKLVQIISDTLEIGLEDGYEAEETTELRLYLLEVLDLVADKITIELPTKFIPSTNYKVRLFPLLVALTRSPDRALLLASFRVLTTLSKKDTSDPVFSLSAYDSSSAYPHPVETAIELLPILDLDITLTVLDFIYQHTLLPANSISFCARPELTAILRLVCAKIQMGGKRELISSEAPSSGVRWYHPIRHPIGFGGLILDDQIRAVEGTNLDELNSLEEPARAIAWMKMVFKPDQESSITQVALWNAYKGQFATESSTLPAGEVIKLSTEAFPDSLPRTKDGKFFIQGIAIRSDLTQVYVCKWKSCRKKKGFELVELLFEHLVSTHIDIENPPTNCSYAHCQYAVSSTLPALAVKGLALHVATHLPIATSPSNLLSTRTRIIPHDDFLPTQKKIYRHERFHAQADKFGELAGVVLLATLVIRNVTGTIKFALGNSAVGGMSIADLTEEGSILEALDAATGGKRKLDNFDQVDYGPARKGSQALLSLESLLVTRVATSHALKVLAEVLEYISSAQTQSMEEETEEDTMML